MTAASEIVKEEGVVKLTLEAVAQRAGVSKGGLLYHYPSKEALIKGMVEDWTNNFFESIKTLVNKDSKETGKWNRAYINTTLFDLDNNNNKNLSSALMAAMFINPDLLDELLTYSKTLTHIKCHGIMIIGPNTDNSEEIRTTFKQAKQLFENTQKKYPEITELSMGMSHDYSIAYLEGSTIFRIGSLLFGQRR